MAEYQVCTKGIWDARVPGIKFGEDGTSNYARLQERLMQMYPGGDKGQGAWEAIVAEMKARGRRSQYDCIVGVSGGVDSSYLLYLASRFHLRPLAVNLDNGWNSEVAVKNIKKVTRELDIDLVTYVINYEEMKDLHKVYIKASLPWIDMPTDLAIKSVMYFYARKERVKYILRGNDFRSEGKQPTEWTYGDTKQLKYLHGRFGELHRLRTYPFLTLPSQIYSASVRGIKDVRPYYFLDYSKQEARVFLERNFGWDYYGGHHHENIFTKFTMSYWLPKKFGIDKRIINLSAQLLSGKITREDALEQIRKPALTASEAGSLLKYVLKKLDMSEEEFNLYFERPNKFFYDYPSNYQLVYRNVKYLDPLIRRYYSFKPTSIVEAEFRREK